MKLSVTLANYNHARFLSSCLDGVLSQTYGDVELLVTDDGSTDESRDILREYERRDARVRVEYLPTNLGAMAAFQRSYARATGDLIYATASDDYLVDSRFFEGVVEALKAHPAAGGVFARHRVVWSDTGALVDVAGRSPALGFLEASECLPAFLLGRLLACGLSSVWRLPCVRAVGGYPVELGPCAEIYVSHALLSTSGGVFLPAIVGVARIPRDGSSYSEAMEAAARARVWARLEARLRQLPSSAFVDPQAFGTFRRRVIEEFVRDHRLTTESQWHLRSLIAAAPAICRAKALHDPWQRIQQGAQEVLRFAERERAEIEAIFEEETGVSMPTAVESEPEAARDAKTLLQARILESLSRHARWIQDRAKCQPFRVAVYGAGVHTRLLLRIWNALALPDCRWVLVTDESPVASVNDIPVVRFSDLHPGDLELIVLSSRTYEPEMAEVCMRHFPGVSRLAIWNPDMSSFPAEP